jgi:membrane fusion protein, multidrug efflux system
MRIWPVPLVLIGLLALSGCDSTAQEEASAPTPVRTAVAFDGPAAPTIRTNGMLVNKDEIRLSFKVGGVIRHLSVMEGEHVRKGQKLAEIEQTEVNAQVEQARQASQKAARDAERGERLYHDQVISLEQLQDLKTQGAMAAAALRSAEFNSGYAVIVAPDDGTILRRLAEERELVAAGSPIVVFGAHDRGFVVRAGMADREIVQVKLGDPVQIRLDALPDATLSGKITEVASGADNASGMFMVEIAVDRADQPLKSGLVAKVQIAPTSARSSERVYVPIGAIVEGNGRTASVFVLTENHAQRRTVEVAFIDNDVVALSKGLRAGEKVITDGALYLEDGESVSVQEAG